MIKGCNACMLCKVASWVSENESRSWSILHSSLLGQNHGAMQERNMRMVEQMPKDVLVSLNRLFIRSVLELGNAGLNDMACRLAGEGWALLRHDNSREAERLNGVLHSLTRSHCQSATTRREEIYNG